MELLFIYGTLKNDFENNYILKNINAKFICNVSTSLKYPLFQLNQNFPYLQNTSGLGHFVKGELWEVEKIYINELDYFEGTPTLYYRDKIEVFDIDNKLFNAHSYFKTDILSNEILSSIELIEEWKNYKCIDNNK
jgi:gamma-glutamylcyclotransferase (GGCT)/AIG2-like uncharacterized protein YtfP